MFDAWLAYFRDNPRGYWFKRKLFGWGWVPVTWQGWGIIGLFLLYIFYLAFMLEQTSNPFLYLSLLGVGVVVLIIICYWKGERPAWQWGVPKKYKEKS